MVAFSVASIMIPGYFSPATGNTSAAPAGRTGSPGDGLSCTSCHTGTATTEAGLITSDIPAAGYMPGQVYTITATVTMAGKTKFGFQVSPQNTSGTKLGTLNVTNPTHTTLVGSGKYITHKTAGTSFSSGTATWSFTWTAPALGSGPVTFYGAFNITNANGNSSGDMIKLSTLTVPQDPTASVAENEFAASITVFPNPAGEQLNISGGTGDEGPSVISFYSIDGRLVKKVENPYLSTVVGLEGIEPGYYLLRIENEKGTATRKFIKK